MKRRIRQTIEYHAAISGLTPQQLQELLRISRQCTASNPRVAQACRLAHRPILPPISYYYLTAPGRLIALTAALASLLAFLPPFLSRNPFTLYDLARPLILLILAIIAALAMPHRQSLSTRILRLANLLILSAAAGIPLSLPLVQRSPTISLFFLIAVTTLIATLALTAAYLLHPIRKLV